MQGRGSGRPRWPPATQRWERRGTQVAPAIQFCAWYNYKKTGQEETISCYSVFLIHIFTALPVLNPKQMVQLSPSPPARMIPGASLQRVYISKDNSTSTSYPDPQPSEHPYTSSLLTQTCPCLAPAPAGVSCPLFKGKLGHKLLDAALEEKVAVKRKTKNKKQKEKRRKIPV